jgi:hypothetical protein
MSLVQYRDNKRIELAFDQWIEDIRPRYWTTFTFNGHRFGEERNNRWLKGKGETQMRKEVLLDDKERTRFIEEARKALYNHFKRLAIKSKSHLLVIGAGGIQPLGGKPHFHAIVKPDKEITYSLLREELIQRWVKLNGSSSADVRMFNALYYGEEHIQIRRAFISRWNKIFSSNNKDLLEYYKELKKKSVGGYMMKHPEEFIEVFCPKRSVRCKRGNCKQGKIFN